MPLTDSFLLATNDALTVEFGGVYQLVHQTNLGDGAQDKVLYFGSVLATRQIQAASNPGIDNIIISVVDVLPVWGTATEYNIGDCLQPTIENTYRYRCTVAGTTGATEPVWPTSGIGSTVIDGTVVWELQGPKHTVDEITLATSAAALDTNIAGDPLLLGAVISGGVDNLVEVHIRIENAVTVVANTGIIPDIALSIVGIAETEVTS